MKHYTTREQSKKLLELGLNPETADMYFSLWEEDPDIMGPYMMESAPFEWKEITVYDRALPCWSLGALLEMMPIIKRDIDEYLPYFIKGSEIWKGKIQSFWYCSYALLDDSNTELITFQNSTAIEAASNMVVWLLENEYIK